MWPNLSDGEWDILLKASGSVVAIIVAYIQIRAFRLNSRSSLKTDLEIFNLLDKADPNYEIIKKGISLRINQYALRSFPSLKKGNYEWPGIIFSFIWALGFAYWTFYLLKPGFTWWTIITGSMTILGLLGVIGGFVYPKNKSEK